MRTNGGGVFEKYLFDFPLLLGMTGSLQRLTVRPTTVSLEVEWEDESVMRMVALMTDYRRVYEFENPYECDAGMSKFKEFLAGLGLLSTMILIVTDR